MSRGLDNLKQQYIGRFAPSPTGSLHFGSILAALASYLDAKRNNGLWLLRIDDLDTPRLEPGADARILAGLEKLGMQWDGDVLYQSQRHEAYSDAINQLKSKELLYNCHCTRKLVAGKPYSGTCSQLSLGTERQYAVRVKTEAEPCILHDLIQPDFKQNLNKDVGDFIVKRSDGLYAYHLAVVLDDAYQQISHIIRGADLMDSTPRQIYLQKMLGLKTPLYAHFPVATDLYGAKISKQFGAIDVLSTNQPTAILFNALNFLNQKPDSNLLGATVDDVIQWGRENWILSNVPKLPAIIAPEEFLSQK